MGEQVCAAVLDPNTPYYCCGERFIGAWGTVLFHWCGGFTIYILYKEPRIRRSGEEGVKVSPKVRT